MVGVVVGLWFVSGRLVCGVFVLSWNFKPVVEQWLVPSRTLGRHAVNIARLRIDFSIADRAQRQGLRDGDNPDSSKD